MLGRTVALALARGGELGLGPSSEQCRLKCVQRLHRIAPSAVVIPGSHRVFCYGCSNPSLHLPVPNTGSTDEGT